MGRKTHLNLWRNMISWFVILVGLLTFLKGFFPQKTVIPGYNATPAPVEPRFSKLVFMVVDALRSDLMFGFNAQMPNVHEYIKEGYALPFTGYSNPPTVTLPRLKGITTGGAPSFLDAVLNIAEGTAASDLGDSWVHQLVRNNRTIHMYGDDTWLKLFPNMFNKTDGTSSFFVNDYTEVDLNVTRHVKPSLEHKSDWDCLILHYLGLDHIGHKGGPNSPLMGPKQSEMDAIIDQLYKGLDDDTLLIVTGDHGMNEVGNHGGSSAGETSAALLFLAKEQLCTGNPAPRTDNGGGYDFYRMIPQIDLVPTITMLLGLPVPQNSLGLPIPELVESQEYMCEHFERLLKTEFECTRENLLELQDQYMRASTEYNQPTMIAGLCITLLGLVGALYCFLTGPSTGKVAWIVSTALYGVAMFGSSTIEEEHQYWYWGFGGIALICTFLRIGTPLRWALALAAFRLVRGWHVTGQKWIGPESYSISSVLLDAPILLWSLVVLVYLFMVIKSKGDYIGLVAILFSAVFKLSTAILAGYKIPLFENLLHEMLADTSVATLLYRCMLAVLALRVVQRKAFRPALEVLLISQSRIVDIPLFLLYAIIKTALKPSVFAEATWAGSLVTLALQYSSFFAVGGSNSLATVDLSNAYNGISSYNIPLVSLLTFVSNWAGPIYWAANGPRKDWHGQYALFYASGTMCIIFACYLLQDHLFVWTVFSPKVLYVGAWMVFIGGETLLCSR